MKKLQLFIAFFSYEFEKYCTSLEDVRHTLDDRLQQWNEYEGTFDRLLTWLSETETSLKDYVPRSSLEQKEDQLEKYQVRNSFFSETNFWKKIRLDNFNTLWREDKTFSYYKKVSLSCTAHLFIFQLRPFSVVCALFNQNENQNKSLIDLLFKI